MTRALKSLDLVVINPGTHPELMHFTEAALSAGLSVKYLTAASFPSDGRLKWLTSLRLLDRLPLISQLRRRLLPPALSRDVVVRHGGFADVPFYFFRQMGWRGHEWLMRYRDRTFQAGVLRSMKKWGDPRIVVAQQTGAFRVFPALSPSVVKVLNYPIAHHGWVREALSEETRRNPSWARYLQGHNVEPTEYARWDLEIADANLVLVNSSFSRRTFLTQGVPERKLRTLLLGADLSPARRESVGSRTSLSPLRVVYAGQITQRKGISYLIEAVELLDDVTLTLVGHPVAGITDHLRSHPRVIHRASVPQHVLREIYRSTDVFAMPSLSEGFGLSAIEAMSEGLVPVVSTRTFGEDIIEPGISGFVVPPANVESLASVLTTLRDDRDRLKRMSEAAQERSRLFTWDRYREEAAELVVELRDRRR